MSMKEVPGKGLALSSLGTLIACFLVFASRAPDGDLLTRELLKAAFGVSIAGCVSAAAAGWLPCVGGPEEPVAAARREAPSPDVRRSFALRATVAAMLGYLLYELTDWFGIHTCMFTALFIAASDTDASLLRGRLRMAGAIGGSVAAICAIVFIVPGLDSVAGLIVLVAPVTFVAAWIAVGPARFAYLGLQVGLAFYLALLGRSGPTTDLHSARDRMVGVLLGVALVALAFDGFHARSRREPAAA
jgi:multidrug resistance protein MdtO